MKKKKLILFSIFSILSSTVWATGDSLVVAKGDTLQLGTSFTIALKHFQLKDEKSAVQIKIGRPQSNSIRGLSIVIDPSRIYAYTGNDTTLLASGLIDGLRRHEYTIVRYGTALLRFYRNGAWIGTMREALLNGKNEPYISLHHINSLKEGFVCEVSSQSNALLPVEREFETNTNTMLPLSYGNLINDPYCNKGFDRTGVNATTRNFYTALASYTGWGSEAYMDADSAYSGNYCIRLEGKAVYPSQGASLDQTVSLAANSTYLVRAMIKSQGYEGKMAIAGESDFMPIRDTQSKWKQVEALLSTTAARTSIYLNNTDYPHGGVLYVDNFELYPTYTSTSSISTTATSLAAVQLNATQYWSPPLPTNVYMLGFTDNGSSCSQIDTSKVTIDGSVYLYKSIKGSQMYAINFPGELKQITVSGRYDGNNYANQPLVAGEDYLLQRYEHPHFEFLNNNTTIEQGTYILQFVDNLDGLQVRFQFAAPRELPKKTATYALVGNPFYCNYKPKGLFLKFDEAAQRFVRTQGDELKPFEAYISTDDITPLYQIVPNGSNEIMNRLISKTDTLITFRVMPEGVIFTASESCELTIYSIVGERIKTLRLQPGDTTISLPRGVYVVAKKKLIVR